MTNIAKMDLVIPDITATFVGTKDRDGFVEVLNDFSNAKEVRILTYSNIKNESNKMKRLRELSPETSLHIIVALPGLYSKKDNSYSEKEIEDKLEKIKHQFNPKQYAAKDVKISVCFKNHAKLIGTENILYIGSANYSDFSYENYEAGMIIRDKTVIREIYDKFFDEIVSVRYCDDGYDTIRLRLLAIMNDLLDLYTYIEEFTVFFDERSENMKNIQSLNSRLLSSVTDLVKSLEAYEEELLDPLIDKLNNVQLMLSGIEEYIKNAFASCYDKGIEHFADYYEESHMSKMGVHSSDAWIDEETPYLQLFEEQIEDQISYIEEYWENELKRNSDVKETKEVVYACYEEMKELISLLEKLSYELFKSKLIKAGTDKNALK